MEASSTADAAPRALSKSESAALRSRVAELHATKGYTTARQVLEQLQPEASFRDFVTLGRVKKVWRELEFDEAAKAEGERQAANEASLSECTLCAKSLESGQPLTRLACGHKLHERCWNERTRASQPQFA